jgi:hypothetical protein
MCEKDLGSAVELSLVKLSLLNLCGTTGATSANQAVVVRRLKVCVRTIGPSNLLMVWFLALSQIVIRFSPFA